MNKLFSYFMYAFHFLFRNIGDPRFMKELIDIAVILLGKNTFLYNQILTF